MSGPQEEEGLTGRGGAGPGSGLGRKSCLTSPFGSTAPSSGPGLPYNFSALSQRLHSQQFHQIMSRPSPKPAASSRPRRGAAASHTQEHVNEKNIGSSSKPAEKKGSDEVTASSAATGTSPRMSTTEAKAVKIESEKSQSSEPPVIHEKKPKGKPKKGSEPQTLPKHASDTGSKHAHKEKALSRSNEQIVSEKSSESKTKFQDAPSADGESVAGGVTVATASDKVVVKKKEKKSLKPTLPMESTLNKLSDKSGVNAALDDLIDTLGECEDTNKDDPPYTGPVVLDPMNSTYLEALGIKEGTIPPEYRKLLEKNEAITGPLPDSPKPMGTDHAIDALSSDFTCSSPTGKQTEKEKSTGEISKAQSAGVTRSAVPPQEKKRKVEEGVMNDQALQALSDSLGTRQPDPQSHLRQAKQVKEAKAKEERQEKCGEDEDTVPAEYRLKPAKDKDGKLLLPEPEETAKCLSESELIGELSADFVQPTYQEKPSMPAEKIEDKDGKPLLPKEPQEQLAPLSDDFLLDALSQDFSSSANILSLGFEDAKLSAAVSETVSQVPAPSNHTAAPPPGTERRDKELDDALDELSDSLGQRQPDPDENKPLDDKVKEKIKAEHSEKLGERDDTIPPEYRHLLDNDGKDKPEKPLTKNTEKPGQDQDPIDALSEDLDSCPPTTETSQNTTKEKGKKTSSSKASKNEEKTKDSSKKTEEVPKPKVDEDAT